MNNSNSSSSADQPAKPGAAPTVAEEGGGTTPAAEADCSGTYFPPPVSEIKFENIQGNCFGGFLKDHQVNILFAIDDADAGRAKMTFGPANDPSSPTTGIDLNATGSIFSHVKHSSSQAVIRFNEQFRALRHAGMDEGTIKATWTNLVFTAPGLSKMKPGRANLSDAFEQGMAERAEAIGDIDVRGENEELLVANAPAHWNDDMDVEVEWDQVDGMLILASDDPEEMNRMNVGSRLARTLAKLGAADSGISILGLIRGETRVDDVGHEHFGFKDGISQPGIRGVDASDDPLHNADQGNPGQDLLHPGEFVLGYPRQDEHEGHDKEGHVIGGPNPVGIDSETFPGADYAIDGSFLVFRRLAQDVKGFREMVAQKAASLGLTTDLMGAKLVGRYRSGAPLEALAFQSGTATYEVPMIDPGIAHPALANSNALNNDFEYGDDPLGEIVPLAAHIRKAYPRNQIPTFEDGPFPSTGNHDTDEARAESRTQTHRLLRRGIPFGKSLGTSEGGGADDPRGLLFFAYQSNIERQFEFVQRAWVNDPYFPRKAEGSLEQAGRDPIINNDTAEDAMRGCPFHKLAAKSACPVSFKHFVKTRGGAYFFSPAIESLKQMLS